MTWKPTAWLAAAVCATGLFIAVFERGVESGRPAAAPGRPLLGLPRDQISRIEIQGPRYAVDCALRGTLWTMAGDRAIRVNGGRINRILEAAYGLREREVITPALQRKRGLSIENFGLSQPRWVCVFSGGRGRERIFFGADAPLGGGIYAMAGGSSNVVETGRELVDALPGDADALRDDTVFPAWVSNARKIEIKHTGGFVQLALRSGEWRVQQPRDERADATKVEYLIRRMEEMKVAAFTATPSSGETMVYGLGADEASLQVTVSAGAESGPLTAAFGKPVQEGGDTVYARVSDMGVVCTVRTGDVQALCVTAADVADRRICGAEPDSIGVIQMQQGDRKIRLERATGGWMLSDPIRYRADTLAVSALLKNLCGLRREGTQEGPLTNGIPQEVRDGALRIALSERPAAAETNKPAAPGRSWTFLIGTNAVQDLVPVFREESSLLSRIRRTEARQFMAVSPGEAPDLLDPRRYMDPRILDVNVDSIRRMTLVVEGREQTVTRDAAGAWAADSPPGAAASAEAVRVVLGAVGNLRASQITSVGVVSDLSRYGLAESATRLTIGLTGVAGIQKTIVVGSQNGAGGVYAMVQGQDVVFVVSKETAEALTRSLTALPQP